MTTEPEVEEVQIKPYKDPSEASIAAQATPGIPTFKQVAPDAAKRMGMLDKRENEQYEHLEQLDKDDSKLALERKQGLKAPRQAYEDALKAAMPDELHLQDAPRAPDSPLVDTEQFQKFGMFAFPFVMLLGKAMRADGVMALNALSSSMRGFREGSVEKSKHDFDVFKAKFDKVVQDNKTKLDEYMNIMKRKDINMQLKQQLLQLKTSEYDDAPMYNSTLRHSVTDQLKQIDNERKNTLTLAQKSIDIQKNWEKNFNEQQKRKMIEHIARDRYTHRQEKGGDALTQKNYTFFDTSRQAAFKEYASKMAIIAAQAMSDNNRMYAERELRAAFVFKMKMINDQARLRGLNISPMEEAAEKPENDPMGPTAGEDSEATQKHWWQFWKSQADQLPSPTPLGQLPQQQPPPQAPVQGGGGWSATPK